MGNGELVVGLKSSWVRKVGRFEETVGSEDLDYFEVLTNCCGFGS